MRKNKRFLIPAFLICSALLAQACAPLIKPEPAAQPEASQQETLPASAEKLTPALTSEHSPAEIAATPGPGPQPTPSLPEPCLKLDPDLPAGIRQKLKKSASDLNCQTDTQPSYELGFLKGSQTAQWVFALVAPFNTVNDDFSAEEFSEYWQGITEKPFQRLIMSRSTKKAMVSLFGEPAGVVIEEPEGSLLDDAWQTPGTWAVIPFEALEPRWKVISMDGNSPLHKDFDPASYPLLAGVGLSEPEGAEALNERLRQVLPATNRDPDKLTTVMVTGTTALVRATAYAMEQEGIDKPAAVIAELLRQADIMHVSNEVAYAEDCPYPNPVTQSMSFCAPFAYNQVLEDIGTDVVELTGDHFVDWGFEAANKTVDLYHSLGWQIFGGGKDLESAQKPALFEVNGNKVAFVGCNAKHGGWNVATAHNSGALDCNIEFLHGQIRELKQQGYTVITTFQHYEDYGWFPDSALEYDMQQAALAGADIVSGSQAHRPQIYSFAGSQQKQFIHFGLGNLFFDQILLGNDCEKGFLDRHVIYDGKYISTELLTIIFPNFLQPVWMTPQERALFLGTLHAFSDRYRVALSSQP